MMPATDPVDWLERFALGFTILPVTAPIAWAAAALEWELRDSCDRHILATAFRVIAGRPQGRPAVRGPPSGPEFPDKP